MGAGRLSGRHISSGDSLTFGDFDTKSLGISDRLLFLRVVTNEGIWRCHLKCWSQVFQSQLHQHHAKISPSSSHLVKKMLLADSTDLADVVNKANVSFCCSITFTDTDVSEPLQEISPRVRPYPVPQGQSHFMVSVSVTLQGGEQKRCLLPSTDRCQNSTFSGIKFTKEVRLVSR